MSRTQYAHYVAAGPGLTAWFLAVGAVAAGVVVTCLAAVGDPAPTSRATAVLAAVALDVGCVLYVNWLLRRIAMALEVQNGQLYWRAPLAHGQAALTDLRKARRELMRAGSVTRIPVAGQRPIRVWRTRELRDFLRQLGEFAPQTR